MKDYSRAAIKSEVILPNLITITSATAVGKTATMRALKALYEAKGLPMEFVSAGSIMRDFIPTLPPHLNIKTIEEFSAFNRANPQAGYDLLCDEQIRLRALSDNQIIEGRLVHVFAPRAFHVRLICPLEVRASRRAKDPKQNEAGLSENLIANLIAQRDRDDSARYASLYPNCLWADSDFDFTILTEHNAPTEVAQCIYWSHARFVLDPMHLVTA